VSCQRHDPQTLGPLLLADGRGPAPDVVPGNLRVQFKRGVERRADEEALPSHVVDISLHMAAGVGALQPGMPTVELRAESGHGLGLERVQDKIPLGGK
jgi:hypothetical protein